MADREQLKSARFAPFARPVQKNARGAPVPEGAADPPAEDDLPPIEQFLDELPSIDDYLAAPATETVAESYSLDVDVAVDSPDREGWAIAGWQSYDWSGLAALATPAAGRGGAGSSRSRWPNMEPDQDPNLDYSAVTSTGAAGAEEVASVLDDLAYRIRSGELPIDQFRNQPPEAAMVAALAAMLRRRG